MLFSPELSRAGLLDMGGSEVRWFGLLDVPDERSYFSYSEALVDGQLECGVFYSCLLPIEGGWAVVRFTAEHLAVPDFHMAQWPARTRVCLVRQKVERLPGMRITASLSKKMKHGIYIYIHLCVCLCAYVYMYVYVT